MLSYDLDAKKLCDDPWTSNDSIWLKLWKFVEKSVRLPFRCVQWQKKHCFYNTIVKDIRTFYICIQISPNNLELYLVGHHKILVTGLLWVRVRTGFSKFLVSHMEIWFSTNDASWWSLCVSTTSPYTAFVGVEVTALLESEMKIIELSKFLNILLR
jgi:hypothetical protein